jgi:hypothetical protein
LSRLRRNGFRKLALLFSVAATAATSVVMLTTPGSSPAATVLPKPVTGWENPVLVSTTQAHRETSLALNPKDPNNLAICDPSGVPNTSTKQSYFHRSVDAGLHWSFMRVETAQTDTRQYAFEGGDCDVAFDAGGNMWSADTWLGDLSVGHSGDGGTTWDGTAFAVTSPIVDRPWLVGGPAGTIHVSYQDLQCCVPSAIWYTRSTDNGQTFLPAVPVTDASPDGAYTWEGNFVVSPNGNDLYLVYTRRQGAALGSLDDTGPETVWVAASHDAGLTWASTKIASMPNPASYLYPSIGMDAGGHLHVVFASKTATDRPIWYQYSPDGTTWTPPVAIMRDTTGYSPWIAGGASGQAAIAWLGSPEPSADSTTTTDWYFYTARVSVGVDNVPVFTPTTTTVTPMLHGKTDIPEFEMVKLDPEGAIHIGMSLFRAGKWAVYYQRECPPAGSSTPRPAECASPTPTPTA